MIFSFSFIQNPILELHKPTYFYNFHYNRTIDWRSVKSWNWNGKIEIKRLPEVMWIETWGSLLLFLLWIWIEPLFPFCSWFFLGKTKNDEGERKNSCRKCCGVLLYKKQVTERWLWDLVQIDVRLCARGPHEFYHDIGSVRSSCMLFRI